MINYYHKDNSIDEEIDSVYLLRRKSSLRRLDVLPFLVLYPVLTVLAYSDALSRLYIVYNMSPEHSFGFTPKDHVSLSLAGLSLLLLAQIVLYMFQQSSAFMLSYIAFDRVHKISLADNVLVIASSHGSPAIVPLHRRQSSSSNIKLIDNSIMKIPIYYFEYHKSIFDFDDEIQLFSKQRCFTSNSLTVINLNNYKGLSTKSFQASEYYWGSNDLDFPIPDFFELFMEHLISPFFVFQSLCLLLWSLDDYWYYSMFTFLMLLLFEGMMCRQRQTSLSNLRRMRRPPLEVLVYRDDKWNKVYSDEISPGDVICINIANDKGNSNENYVPCDLLLLSGVCITNEAMLTGESTPQLKESIETIQDSLEQTLSLRDLGSIDEKTKRHVLYGGTNLLSSYNQEKRSTIISSPISQNIPVPSNYCVGICLQTGFGSLQGKLVRKILFAKETISSANIETFSFIGILVIFAVVASAYVLYDGINDVDKNKFRLALHCIMIVTSVIPPELPMELSLAITTSLGALARNLIFCTEPYRIPYAGKIDVLCFDKTGTLTQDKMRFLGIASPLSSSFEDMSRDSISYHEDHSIVEVDECSDVILSLLGSCHSVFVSGKQLAGDMLEIESFSASGFLFYSPTNFDKVLNNTHNISITLRKKFQFSSNTKRMSVLVQIDHKSSRYEYLFVKGAPEVLESKLARVPSFYWSVYNENASKGYRILAIACKKVDLNAGMKLSQDELERDLVFLGFLLFSSDLKADSKSVVKELTESSNKLVMITGDSLLTSLDVGRRVGLISKSTTPLILSEVLDDVTSAPSFVWRVGDLNYNSKSRRRDDIDLQASSLEALSNKQILCCTGQVLQQFQGSASFDLICRHVTIFARMTPPQKSAVIVSLRRQNMYVLMCGDGTNDVGALRAAHVGISVVNDAGIEERLAKVKAEKNAHNKKSSSKSDRLVRAMAEAQLQEADPTLVQLGDASLASSFTSRRTSIDSVLTVIRQGRCTLVTTIQVYKILALNCLVSAYVMSWMHLQGLRQGDTQMTAVGVMNAGLFFFLSQTKPIDHLASKRPPSTIFTKSVIVSVFGQCVIHFVCLVLIVSMSSLSSEEAYTSVLIPDGSFQPNLINTSVFLLSAIININNFVVNYRGYPYTQGLTDNTTMFRVVCGLYLAVAMVLGDQIVFINDFLQMKTFPSSQYQMNLGLILIGDFLGCMGVEWLCRRME